MKQNLSKNQKPEWYKIAKEKSKLKPASVKVKTYDDVLQRLFPNKKCYYISYTGYIATSDEQLKCILAKNKLANVARYLNGDWEPEPDDLDMEGYYHRLLKDGELQIGTCWISSGLIVFKSKKLAKQAIEILGEEEIKLAAKPLY